MTIMDCPACESLQPAIESLHYPRRRCKEIGALSIRDERERLIVV
jgi:hypothetical protein